MAIVAQKPRIERIRNPSAHIWSEGGVVVVTQKGLVVAIVLSTNLARGFIRDFSEPNKGTGRTWLQLIRSCALHLLRCPNFKKVKGSEVGSEPIGNPKGLEDKGVSWRLTWLIFELLNTNEVTKLLY